MATSDIVEQQQGETNSSEETNTTENPVVQSTSKNTDTPKM